MKHSFISKTDLAVAYFPHLDPHSARHKLMGLIESDTTLLPRLQDSGYRHMSRQFSPRQVDMIIDRYGSPWR